LQLYPLGFIPVARDVQTSHTSA